MYFKMLIKFEGIRFALRRQEVGRQEEKQLWLQWEEEKGKLSSDVCEMSLCSLNANVMQVVCTSLSNPVSSLEIGSS